MIDYEQVKTKLKDRLSELDVRLIEIEHDLDSARPADFEEAATLGEADEMLEELGTVGLIEVRMIEAALDRLDKGRYGECVNCGSQISEERLNAVPHAPLCRDCAGAGRH